MLANAVGKTGKGSHFLPSFLGRLLGHRRPAVAENPAISAKQGLGISGLTSDAAYSHAFLSSPPGTAFTHFIIGIFAWGTLERRESFGQDESNAVGQNRPISLEHKALQEGACLFSRPDLQFALFRGQDRKEFLHRLLSSSVKKLESGQGQPSLLLDSRGKILVRMNLLDRGEDLLAVVEGPFAGRLVESLDRYLFSERVEMKGVSQEFAALSARGPRSAEAIEKMLPGACARAADWSHRTLDWRKAPVTAMRNPEEKGWDIVLPREAERPFAETFVKESASFAASAGLDLLESLRIESGVARYGMEIDESFYPQEAGWDGYCAPDKGCYTGQETVARMRTYGKPPRRLAGLAFPAGREVSRGSSLQRAGIALGSVRSCIRSPQWGVLLGFGLLKFEEAEPGNLLETPAGERAIVLPLPFSEESLHRYLGKPGA